MMPKIRVRPAASRNSSMPNWMPLRHCSIRYNIVGLSVPMNLAADPSVAGWPRSRALQIRPWRLAQNKTAEARASAVSQLAACQWSVRHVALLKVLVLIVLHDRRDGLQPVFVAVLHRFLQVEVLDRDVIGSEFEVPAHRFEVGLLRRAPHLILLAEIAVDGSDNAVEQRHGVVGLGTVEGRIALVSSPVVFDKKCVGLVR